MAVALLRSRDAALRQRDKGAPRAGSAAARTARLTLRPAKEVELDVARVRSYRHVLVRRRPLGARLLLRRPLLEARDRGRACNRMHSSL